MLGSGETAWWSHFEGRQLHVGHGARVNKFMRVMPTSIGTERKVRNNENESPNFQTVDPFIEWRVQISKPSDYFSKVMNLFLYYTLNLFILYLYS